MNKRQTGICHINIFMIMLAAAFVLFSTETIAGQYDTVPTGNPVIRHKYTADPAALVHNGSVYLYTGHDEAPPGRDGYIMHEWLCFSSTDMVNWKSTLLR